MVKVTVIGSSSMDFVVTTRMRPGVGETVMGDSFKVVAGGKGANQAVAAARLGASVTMIGCVGDDYYGQVILDNFKKNGVFTHNVEPVTGIQSGTAHITIADGDNSIVVVKGANNHVTPAIVEKALKVIQTSDIVLIQHEIPLETVDYVSQVCERYGVPLLLNPAPAAPLTEGILRRVSFLTPNEHEAAELFKEQNLSEVLKQYPNKLFITEGKNGVRYFNGNEEILVPAYPVEVVDTTGAGDTFNAAFAVALAEGKEIMDALKFANRAASLSVMKFGAQGGMPTRQELEGCLD
ncbi:ribokinase [Paenibacillus sp. J45TS6]|uniref:ribokinase n=1 Tax=unclassified Paenibacillus TaxID=185978 RepID=UPI001B0772A1|nr:ribokinase [Paenibacillus sp. J45TS6]GIP46311.1 ribokinase [Paenibacillus sp. J45TS6]